MTSAQIFFSPTTEVEPTNKRIFLLIFAFFFLIAAIFAGYQIITTLLEYKEGQDAYNDLSQYVELPPYDPSDETIHDPGTDSDAPFDPDAKRDPSAMPALPVVDFDALHAINRDVIGWLYFADLEISYPVVQSSDNDYYLHRLLDGSYNIAGTIFMDYRNAAALTDRHTILYGHHLKNGAMLAPLMGYKDQAFFEKHPTAYYLTPDAAYELELFSGYTTNVDEDCWDLQFDSDAAFEAWIARAIERSIFISPVVPTAADRIMTLSTCTYEYNDARYVLLGRLTEIRRQP